MVCSRHCAVTRYARPGSQGNSSSAPFSCAPAGFVDCIGHVSKRIQSEILPIRADISADTGDRCGAYRRFRIAQDYPPPITHPEYFYGFIGVVVAWQLLFILLSRDPIRYRPLMLPAIVEKWAYGVALVTLFVNHRVPALLLGFSMVDLAFGVLFAAAFWMTPKS
jgi:hypothetical protein